MVTKRKLRRRKQKKTAATIAKRLIESLRPEVEKIFTEAYQEYLMTGRGVIKLEYCPDLEVELT